jgi:hypothetical protein
MKKKKSLKFKIFIGFSIFVIVLVSVFFIYVGTFYKAGPLALASLKSDAVVKVEQNGDIYFVPVAEAKNIGFIFYPGAKVESRAYSPMAKEIASKGYPVIIAKMTFNLAILSPNRASQIIGKYRNIHTWAIGGHSLGGVMAADYAYNNSGKIKGLVFLAAYPQSKRDFTNFKLKCLSLWGSKDEVADLNKVRSSKKIMPKGSAYIEIKGGNHGGFGDYGHQKGDGQATITNKQQMLDTANYIIKFLNSLN